MTNLKIEPKQNKARKENLDELLKTFSLLNKKFDFGFWLRMILTVFAVGYVYNQPRLREVLKIVVKDQFRRIFSDEKKSN